MGGEGSMFGAIASLRNNRMLLKEKNPFRKRVKDLHVHHIESHDTKHLSAEEMRKLKVKLRKARRLDQLMLVIIFAFLIVGVSVVVIVFAGFTIF